MKVFLIILFFYSLPAVAVVTTLTTTTIDKSWDTVTVWADELGLVELFHPFLKDAREMNWRCKQGKREATHFCEFIRLPDRVDEECMNIVNSSTCIDVDAFRIVMDINTLNIVRSYFPYSVRYWDLEALAVIKDKIYSTNSLFPLVEEEMRRREGLYSIDQRIRYLQSRGVFYFCAHHQVHDPRCEDLHRVDSAFLDFLRNDKKYNFTDVVDNN